MGRTKFIQKGKFPQGIVTGKRTPTFGDRAQTHVHQLNGGGLVNDALYLRPVVKERRDARPDAAPGLHDGAIRSRRSFFFISFDALQFPAI